MMRNYSFKRMDEQLINSYLWHGYLPVIGQTNWMLEDVANLDGVQSYDVKTAAKLLDVIFDKLVASTKGPYLVPLSGGWDSRIILGALLDRVSPSEIHTVSFGRPGQLDFDIGLRISKKVKVNRTSFNLDTFFVTWNDLLESVRESPWTYVPDGLVSQKARLACGLQEEHSYWTGFLGDPLTGSHHTHSDNETSWDVTSLRFMSKQKKIRSNEISSPEPIYSQLDLDPFPFSKYEYLDFNVRQRSCIAPIVLPGGVWNKWDAHQGRVGRCDVVAPFADVSWAKYWLHMPRRHHVNQSLYLNMASEKYPDLFKLPSKHGWGINSKNNVRRNIRKLHFGLRNRLHRQYPILPIRSRLMDNYMDFSWAFRYRADWKEVAITAVDFLYKEQLTPKLEVRKILSEHLKGKRDHAQLLLTLIGLVLNTIVNEPEMERAS